MSKTSAQIVRFLVTGLTAVIVDALAYSLFLTWFTPSFAKASSFACGAIVAYFLNKFWTFETHRHSSVEILRFVSLYLSALCLNVGVNAAMLAIFPQSLFIAFLFATAASAVFNFLGQKYFVFGDDFLRYIRTVDWEEQLFAFNFDWAGILAFVAFWSYGFFGALSRDGASFLENMAVSISLYLIFVLFLAFWHRGAYPRMRVAFTKKDAAVFASFFTILFFLSFKNLMYPLVGDELSYAQQSQIHGTAIISLFSRATHLFQNTAFSYVLYAVNLLTLIAVFLTYKLISRKSFALKVSLLSLAFFSFRFAAIYFGGNASPHPPLRLLPLWLTSSLFGETSFSFRLAQFIGLICLMWFVQRISNKHFPPLNSWLFAFAVGTMPVLWHVGLLAEQAIWTALLWVVFLLYFAEHDDLDISPFHYAAWISAISIFTLLRQSAFVALVPVFVLYGLDLIKKGKFNVGPMLLTLAPLLVMLPFLFHSIISGTPATYSPSEMNYVPQGASSLLRIWIAFQSGVVLNALLNSVRMPWVFFLVPAFLCFYRKPKKLLAFFLFFAGALYVFYSIKPGLWGVGRYQAEYGVPFAVLGFFYVARALQRFGHAKYILPVLFIPLIGYNMYIFQNLAHLNKSVDALVSTFNKEIKVRGHYAILSEFPYAYKEAFKEVRRLGYGDSLYVAGVMYGVFAEILNGFTVSEVASLKDISFTEPTANAITGNRKIDAVLVSDFADHEHLVYDLEKLGWQRREEFRNEEYRSTIFFLTRAGLK